MAGSRGSKRPAAKRQAAPRVADPSVLEQLAGGFEETSPAGDEDAAGSAGDAALADGGTTDDVPEPDASANAGASAGAVVPAAGGVSNLSSQEKHRFQRWLQQTRP